MNYAPAQDQLPVLCRSCGGPSGVGPDLVLRCPFCGAVDQLPGDALTRALELKRRLADASRNVAQVEGLERALGSIFEQRGAFLRATGTYLFLFVLVTVWSALSAYPYIVDAPGDFQLGILLYGMMGPFFVGGLVVAMAFSLFVGRMSYRRKIRPLLFARPPRMPGAPARCRACGGDLPPAQGPLMSCRFCTTQNLVTPEIERDRTRLLENEVAFHRSRAANVQANTAKISTHMTRTLIVSIVVVYLSLFGLAALASLALEAAT